MTAGKIRRNWLAWALVASLCVNLAVVGLVIGAALHGKPDRPPPGGEWAMARDLPEPYRENMIAQLRAGRDKWIGPRERIGAQRSALLAAALGAVALKYVMFPLHDGRTYLPVLLPALLLLMASARDALSVIRTGTDSTASRRLQT